MRSAKRFLLTVSGVLFLVVFPVLFYISYHMEKSYPGNDFTITRLHGNADVHYNMEYRVQENDSAPLVLKYSSDRIPLRVGMDIGSGAVIHTADRSNADVMMKDRLALRIQKSSKVKIEHGGPGMTSAHAHLQRGLLWCRVLPREAQTAEDAAPVFTVTTPSAMAKVVGTSFSIEYLPAPEISRIEVLEGMVKTDAPETSAGELVVVAGKMVEVAPSLRIPVLGNIRQDVSMLQRDMETIKITEDFADRWDRINDLVLESPLYRKAVSVITRYEMKIFSRSIRYFSPLRWGNRVPARLDMVELDEGDYLDPWGTAYFYEKLATRKAVLISAGADRLLHTHDDIVLPIIL